MHQPAAEPTTMVLDSMGRMFDQLIERLDGLTVHEYLWEPVGSMWSVRRDPTGTVVVDGAGVRDIDPAPVTTIAWRTWHLAIDCLDDYTRRFGGDVSDAPAKWTLDVAEAVATLRAKWAGYRSVVGDRASDDPLGEYWEHWQHHTTADMAMHASNELVHHAAEIALLRDLYAASAEF